MFKRKERRRGDFAGLGLIGFLCLGAFVVEQGSFGELAWALAAGAMVLLMVLNTEKE
jgi:hypothetical protein